MTDRLPTALRVSQTWGVQQKSPKNGGCTCLIPRLELMTRNQRVRGSSPWRRTNTRVLVSQTAITDHLPTGNRATVPDMSEKMECPGCKSYTSGVLADFNNGEPCRVCKLPYEAASAILAARRRSPDAELTAQPEQAARDEIERDPSPSYADGRPKMHRHFAEFEVHSDEKCDRASSWRRVYVFDADTLDAHEAHIRADERARAYDDVISILTVSGVRTSGRRSRDC
jgi:hypothetical protein